MDSYCRTGSGGTIHRRQMVGIGRAERSSGAKSPPATGSMRMLSVEYSNAAMVPTLSGSFFTWKIPSTGIKIGVFVPYVGLRTIGSWTYIE